MSAADQQRVEQWLHSSPDHGLAWQRLEQRIGQAFSTAPGLSREVLDRAGSSRRHLLRGALSVTGLGLGAVWCALLAFYLTRLSGHLLHLWVIQGGVFAARTSGSTHGSAHSGTWNHNGSLCLSIDLAVGSLQRRHDESAAAQTTGTG